MQFLDGANFFVTTPQGMRCRVDLVGTNDGSTFWGFLLQDGQKKVLLGKVSGMAILRSTEDYLLANDKNEKRKPYSLLVWGTFVGRYDKCRVGEIIKTPCGRRLKVTDVDEEKKVARCEFAPDPISG